MKSQTRTSRGDGHRGRLKVPLGLLGTLTALVSMVTLLLSAAPASAALSGAVFTTDSTCTGVNLNIYEDKDDVYLDGGPKKSGSAGLNPGVYYVKVTDPSG